MTEPAILFDGNSAGRHAVLVDHDDAGLILSGDGIQAATVAWPVLVVIDTLPDAVLLGRTDRPGWRLNLPPDAPVALVGRMRRAPRFGTWVDRFGYLPSLAVCALISGLIMTAVINAPGWLAPHIPMAWENGVSDDAVGDLSKVTCHTPAGDAALASLAARLDHEATAQHLPPVHIELIRADVVNAVALPGGRILVFDGLVQRVGSSDALAGVLGHEIGHVRLHHVMQAVLRQYGLSMVLGNAQSTAANALGRLTMLRYSRDTEDAADAWSRDRLNAAGVSPLPTGRFLASLAQDDPYAQTGTSAFLASHPDPMDRAMAFRAAWLQSRAYRPALDDNAFGAILDACGASQKLDPGPARPRR